jgi:hypothetical protein
MNYLVCGGAVSNVMSHTARAMASAHHKKTMTVWGVRASLYTVINTHNALTDVRTQFGGKTKAPKV